MSGTDDIRRVQDLAVEGKRVFLRLDLNVPIQGKRIGDDTRIRAALPTLRRLLDRGAAVVACSHLGRPKGQVVPGLSLAPVGSTLAKLLPQNEVIMSKDVIGPDARDKALSLEPGRLLLLENVRFEPGETKDDPELGKAFRSLAHFYVNDAFGSAHRAHASVSCAARLYQPNTGMGLLMEKELTYLQVRLEKPAKPYVALLGGAKVSDKLPVLTRLIEKVDVLCIGGAMAYTFLAAQGIPIGNSRVEKEHLEAAGSILKRAQALGVDVQLPVDHIAAPSMDREEEAAPVRGAAVPEGLAAFDIGPETISRFREVVISAGTVVWNGPMGVFERKVFSRGTLAMAGAMAVSPALTVVGGGDSAAAVEMSGESANIDHISTGGGASLELLAGKSLPGVEALRPR